MTRRHALRLAPALAAALALSACATPEEGTPNVLQRAFAPSQDLGTLRLADVPPERQRALAREGQLQTPLTLPAEVTGAPSAQDRNGSGMMLDQNALASAGVDISPDVRVWVEQGGQARLDYGPRPQGGAIQPLSPGVLVNPF